MVPDFPWAQEQFLYCPTQLGPKLSEGSYQAFSPGHPLPNLSWLPLWAGYFFLPKPVLEPVLCRREDKTNDVPQIPIREHTTPQSVLPLLASVCTPMQAPSVRLEDGQEDPHKREVRENTPTQPLLRSKLL